MTFITACTDASRDMSHFPGEKHVFDIYVAYFYPTYMINRDLFYSLIFSFLGETIRILMIISIGFKIDISRHSWHLYTKTPDPMSKLDQGLSIGARVYVIRSNSHIVTIDQSKQQKRRKHSITSVKVYRVLSSVFCFRIGILWSIITMWEFDLIT